MPNLCGYLVDNHCVQTPRAVHLCVDTLALIVRNPHQTIGKGVFVQNRWKTVCSCSSRYLFAQQKIAHSMHNPAVPTGITIGLEFSRI